MKYISSRFFSAFNLYLLVLPVFNFNAAKILTINSFLLSLIHIECTCFACSCILADCQVPGSFNKTVFARFSTSPLSLCAAPPLVPPLHWCRLPSSPLPVQPMEMYILSTECSNFYSPGMCEISVTTTSSDTVEQIIVCQ